MTTIDIFSLWELALATLNTQQGGHLRPRTFIRWVNEISREIFNERKAEWEKNQIIDDELAISFLHTVNVKLTTAGGAGFDSFVYPTDYAHFSSARFLVPPGSEQGRPLEGAAVCDCATGKCIPFKDADDLAREALSAEDAGYVQRNVVKVDNGRWGSALTHRLKGPTRKQPLMTQYKSGFHVAPSGMGVIVLDYLSEPRDAVFAYTLGADDTIVYDATNSIQLEWSTMLQGEFISRIKKRYGSLTRDEQLYAQGSQESKIA